MKRLIIAFDMFVLILASQADAQWQSYRKTQPPEYLENPAVAKIIAALGVPKGPPIEYDRTIKLEDATMSLIGPLEGDARVYRDLQIPRYAIVYVEGRVDLAGSYSLGQEVIMLRHPNSWFTCSGGQGELGEMNGKLVQILGGGPTSQWAGLDIVDGARVAVHEVVIANFGLRRPAINIGQSGSIDRPNDANRLVGDHLYVTNNRGKGLWSFSSGDYTSDSGAEVNLRDSWVADNDSLDLGLSRLIKGEITDSYIGEKVWLFDDEGLLPGEGGISNRDPDSQYSQGAKVVFNNTLPIGLIESLNRRMADEPNLASLLQFTEPRPGRDTPAQIWPTQVPLNPADFDIDGIVGPADFSYLAADFGKTTAESRFGIYYDLDQDGWVGLDDAMLVAKAYFRLEPNANLETLADLLANDVRGKPLLKVVTDYPAVVDAVLADPVLGPVLLNYMQPTAVEEEQVVPTAFGLSQNYPNPFNPSTTINFTLPVKTMVEVAVYNLAGQSIKTLAASTLPADSYQFSWDGTDNNGRQSASGIYVCVLRAGKVVLYNKMTLLR